MVSNAEIEREEARDRAMLSGPDRKWLLLPREEFVEQHSRQYWGQRRDELRERVYNTLLDFALLWEHWDENEIWQLRDSDHRPASHTPIEDAELESGLRDMIVFGLYLANPEPLFHPDKQPISTKGGFSTTAPYVEQFLLQVFKRLGRSHRTYVRDYELTIEGEELMWGKIRKRIERGEDVPPEHLIWILELGALEDVDPEPIQKALQEEFRKQLTGDDPQSDN
jgi:hypothetical protein